MKQEAYLVPNPIAPCLPVIIDEEKCIGCNKCTKKCRTQTIMPNPEKGKPPVLIYPEECWFCGCCIDACEQNAIKLYYPINQEFSSREKKPENCTALVIRKPLHRATLSRPAANCPLS